MRVKLKFQALPSLFPDVKIWGVEFGSFSLVVAYDEEYREWSSSYKRLDKCKEKCMLGPFNSRSEAEEAVIEAVRGKMT